MHRKRHWISILKLALVGAACLFLSTLSPQRFRSATTPATHYVWCGATGAGTGADWANAFTDLPSSLVRGDTYAVAGDSGCTYGYHKFNDAESGTSVITVRKAEASLDSGVAGWQAAFATATAKWTVPQNSDPQDKTNGTLWAFCNGYYSIDGITGTTDPANGGPSSFGFLLQNGNGGQLGNVNFSCQGNSNLSLSNIAISHAEMDGVDRHMPATVMSCSFSAGSSFSASSATVTTAPTSYPWVVGDTIGGWDSSNHIIFTSATIASASGQTITFSIASSPCPTLAEVGLKVGTKALYIFGSNDAYDILTFSNLYIHDFGTPVLEGSVSNSTFTHNFLTRNKSTPIGHSEALSDHTGSNNNTWSYNWLKDIQGTGYLIVLNSGTAGTSNGWNIFGNVFWESDSAANTTGDGVIACINGNTCSNWRIFNNTFYNIASLSARVGWAGASTSSTGNLVYNNLWVASGNVQPNVSTGTVCYDKTAPCASTAQLVQDYNFYDTNNTGATASDVHGHISSVAVSTFFANASSGNFNLLGNTNNMLNTSTLLPANSKDGNGAARGGNGTWDAGAFQFVAPVGAFPNPPLSLAVASVQ